MNCTAQTENRIRSIVKITSLVCLVTLFAAPLVFVAMTQGTAAFLEFIAVVFVGVLFVGVIISLSVIAAIILLWILGDFSICKTKS
jgi:hypothetical protein